MKRAKVFTPSVTAFDRAGRLDVQANIRVCEHLLKGGVDGIVPMGSTGEFYAMPLGEKRLLTEAALSCVRGRAALYVGANCPVMADTIELANAAVDGGADGVMIVSPYYFAYSDEYIMSYYDELADSIRGDIVLYNFPARTGNSLSPAMVLELRRRHANIVGIKDTISDVTHTRAVIDAVEGEYPDFIVFSGCDECLAHCVLSGGDGAISGLSNVYPELFAAWCRAVNTGNARALELCQKAADRLSAFCGERVPLFIPALKAAMVMRGVELEETCLRPVLPLTEQQRKFVAEVVRDMDERMAAIENA